MASTSNVSLSTQTPLAFTDWIRYQTAVSPETEQESYLNYVHAWYAYQNTVQNVTQDAVKQQYVQLAKDLSFLFSSSETSDPFLQNIDYNDPENLIYAIPFFAKKLRQIAIVLQNKRENVKRAKLKYNLIGSEDGLQKLLYEYILRGFTITENSITQVPASPLINYFPDLTAVKDNFYIELEELHDTNSYFDSDPSVPIENYLNITQLTDTFPLSSFDDNMVNQLLSTRFFPRVADTPLSNLFKAYTLSLPTLSTYALSAAPTNLIFNEINISEKYLGEPVYGLTAIRLQDINKPDLVLNLSFTNGNNWFYWPSGNRVVNDSIYNDFLQPILINDSNLVGSGATGGTNYRNSDLIFTDKNGVLEGAWLQGPHNQTVKADMVATIDGGATREFIFPFPGLLLNSKSLTFNDFYINDTYSNSQLANVAPQIKVDALNAYYSAATPLTSCNPIYLNQTNIIDTTNASSAQFSPDADNIVKKFKISNNINNYSEFKYGGIEQAYLYRFERTDIPIQAGSTTIHWPIHTFDAANDNNPITITSNYCLPITLGDINPMYAMVGAVAGTNVNNADVIYKLNSKTGDPMEAAWLGSGVVSGLDIIANSINVYDSPATNCSLPVVGSVQPSCSFIANGGDRISFIWCDADTPADNVFKYVEHLPTCPYGKSMPNDLYSDQDYQNPNPININDTWSKCICHSVNYSPIGNYGNSVLDYNGIADYLFADPQGLGINFSLNSWTDTRGFDANNSPQFAFFQLQNGDSQVGFGEGTWKTGSGDPFILKTGRRYTYYRTSLRADYTSNATPPYFVSNYQYQNIKGLYQSPENYDVVILLDVSRSESNNIENMKSIVISVIDKILNNNNNVAINPNFTPPTIQVSVVTFGTNQSRLSYLTNNYSNLELFVSQGVYVSHDPSQYQTNIAGALSIAQTLLTTQQGNTNTFSTSSTNTIASICNNLNFYLYEETYGQPTYLNNPQYVTNPNNSKSKILIFSDGLENVYLDSNSNEYSVLTNNLSSASNFANNLIQQGIEIYGINIGDLSSSNDLIKQISTSNDYYFDLESYLKSGDGNTDNFAEYISQKLGYSISVKPMWYKAIKDSTGNWKSTYELSDMVISAGDFIMYNHRGSTSYTCPTNPYANFAQPSISFMMNVKLDGWDYTTNTFDTNNKGDSYGGRPFWANVYTSPDALNNFYKGTMALGGQVRFFNDYVPFHQPEISSMVLNAGDNIQYVRNSPDQIIWNQPLTFNVLISSYQWNQLNFSESYSNLADFLRTNKFDGIIYDTNIASEMTLESYSQFKPAYYNYYALNSFQYNEDLYYIDRCLTSFVTYNTAITIQPAEPYAHLDNVHYPTVATVSLPSNAVTDKQVGEYLLPEKLGTSFFRGRGYTIELDNSSLTYIDSISAERMFLDLGKYGPRQRGLTKKDQITPTMITDISNGWIYEPYSSASKAGVMTDVLENQKLTPYQTSYEIYQKNYYGLARQNDVVEFWTPNKNGIEIWNDTTNYPLNFIKELPPSEYTQRKEKLLTNMGNLNNWRTDVFGNDYGIYKQFSPVDLDGLYMWFSADYGVVNTVNTTNPFLPDTFATNLGDTVAKWIDRSGKNNYLVTDIGSPVLSSFNGMPTVNFGVSSNMHNLYNLNNSEVTMFVVGAYANANNLYSFDNYQVIAAFGTYLSSADLKYVSDGALVFSQKYNDFNFVFGNTQGGYSPTSAINIPYIELTDYYGYYNNTFYPPTSNLYLFETVFSQPYAEVYINGTLFADNKGTLVPSDSANYFDAPLASTGGFYIGSYIQNALTTNCSISEIIFYNRALTDSERQQIEEYLNNKYSIY